MPRAAHPRRAAALVAIRDAIATHGDAAGPGSARKAFMDIPESAWKAWIRLVRYGDRVDDEQAVLVPEPTHLVTPITVCADERAFDFDGRVAEMDAAARALIDYAWPRDPETGRRGRVKNPMLLKAAHAALAQTAGLVVRHQEQAWNVERMQEYQDGVITAIGNVLRDAKDRELAGQIIAALGALKARWENPHEAMKLP
jgi:hypothetical protein